MKDMKLEKMKIFQKQQNQTVQKAIQLQQAYL